MDVDVWEDITALAKQLKECDREGDPVLFSSWNAGCGTILNHRRFQLKELSNTGSKSNSTGELAVKGDNEQWTSLSRG